MKTGHNRCGGSACCRSPQDELDFGKMEPMAIRNPFSGAVCFFVGETESTMVEARKLARRGSAAGSLVATDYQRAGRGRLTERRWESEAGANLLFTLRLDPAAASHRGLPLRVGGTLCRAVGLYASRRSLRLPSLPLIKWPNDLLIGGRKAAGILCESKPAGEEAGVYLGIGVNCNQTVFPAPLSASVTSLALELGQPIGRWSLLELILDQLEAELSKASWREGVEELLWRRGESVRFRAGAPGIGEPIVGRLEGVDDMGSLLIRPDGEARSRPFASGEIILHEVEAS